MKKMIRNLLRWLQGDDERSRQRRRQEIREQFYLRHVDVGGEKSYIVIICGSTCIRRFDNTSTQAEIMAEIEALQSGAVEFYDNVICKNYE